MTAARDNSLDLAKSVRPENVQEAVKQTPATFDFLSIYGKGPLETPGRKVNPEVAEFAAELEGRSAISCAFDLRLKLNTMKPAQAKAFVEQLRVAQNIKYAPELILTNTKSGTKVEFIDTLSKSNLREQVATITDKEVITEDNTPLFRRSTDAQLALMGQWVVMKGGFEAYKCLVRGSAFNPKVALAELATVAVIAAAVAPAYNELFEAYRKKQSKHW
ncbi:MAG: hypothetical protein Q8T09_13950 [Candidatus Melainabacteria bacterium]|nr:hypothetical protein [Candidatus Melainabacteria bacterium]